MIKASAGRCLKGPVLLLKRIQISSILTNCKGDLRLICEFAAQHSPSGSLQELVCTLSTSRGCLYSWAACCSHSPQLLSFRWWYYSFPFNCCEGLEYQDHWHTNYAMVALRQGGQGTVAYVFVAFVLSCSMWCSYCLSFQELVCTMSSWEAPYIPAAVSLFKVLSTGDIINNIPSLQIKWG